LPRDSGTGKTHLLIPRSSGMTLCRSLPGFHRRR
jgi:hypothetical protein